MDADIEKIFGQTMKSKSGSVTGNAITPDSAGSSDGSSIPIPTTMPMTRLASHVQSIYRIASDHRQSCGIDQKLTDAANSTRSMFTPEQKQKMVAAGLNPKLFAPLTDTKVRAAKSQMNDIFASAQDKPWILAPTPDPEVPSKVAQRCVEDVAKEIALMFQQSGVLNPQQMGAAQEIITARTIEHYDEIMNFEREWADQRVRRMERKVHDYMIEGGWISAFADYVGYICAYGTGLIVGPCERVMPKAKCKDTDLGGLKYTMEYRVIPTYEAVSPWDCYPAPNARNIDDGPLCIRVRYMANELWQFTEKAKDKKTDEIDGWNPKTVRALLSVYPNGGVRLDQEAYDVVRREAENHGMNNNFDCTLEGIRCFDSIRGSMLIDFGVTKTRDGKKIVEEDYYRTETIVIAGYVVYCRILDERMGIPVSKGVFYEVPGSWWGDCIADKLVASQAMMNNALKSIFQNMAVSSVPQFYMNDASRFIDRDGSGMKVRAGKMWTFQQSMIGNQGAPMGVLPIPSNAAELIQIYEQASKQADNDSGIPAYTYGQSSGSGALRTASGLAMLTEAANRGMKMAISTTDRLVIRDVVRRTCVWELINGDDMSIKGDCDVNPAGMMGKILKAQEDQARMQFIQMAGQHQFLSNAIGVKGFVELARPTIQDLGINPDRVLPSEDKLRDMELIEQIKMVMQATQAQDQQQQQEDVGPSPEVANQARVEGNPQQVAMQQGAGSQGGQVAERRNVA